jgi:murein DD-endopeptidase MepM/ murein hydrolase activator NlpD
VRRWFNQVLSVSAMAGVAALIVSTSLPANAFSTADAPASQSTAAVAPKAATEVDTQQVTVNAAAATAAAAVAPVVRDTYEARSLVQQIRVLSSSNHGFAYTNNPNGSIQWPFVGTVPISYGFGPRSACSFCSTYHLGVDFTPGSGVPIQAITEGVVSEVNLDSGGLGNHVIIDHVVNGQRVQSVYAHMQWGSIKVAVGQPVSVGTIVGLVGSTGASTGAHLHLEIHIDGTPIDPFAWLKANAN